MSITSLFPQNLENNANTYLVGEVGVEINISEYKFVAVAATNLDFSCFYLQKVRPQSEQRCCMPNLPILLNSSLELLVLHPAAR